MKESRYNFLLIPVLFILPFEVVLSALNALSAFNEIWVDLQTSLLAEMAAVPAASGHLCLHMVSFGGTSQESKSLARQVNVIVDVERMFQAIKKTQNNTLPKALLVYKPMDLLLLYQISHTRTKFNNPNSLLDLWGRHIQQQLVNKSIL